MSANITKTNPFGSGHSKFIYACLEKGLIKNYEDISDFIASLYASKMSCYEIAENFMSKYQIKVSARNISDYVAKSGLTRTCQEAKIIAIAGGRMIYKRISPEEKQKRKQINPATRITVLERDGRHCQICGATAADNYRLELHHINFDPTDNYPCNLQTLCNLCHKGLHAVQNNGIL